jgi:hypothetical protein
MFLIFQTSSASPGIENKKRADPEDQPVQQMQEAVNIGICSNASQYSTYVLFLSRINFDANIIRSICNELPERNKRAPQPIGSSTDYQGYQE